MARDIHRRSGGVIKTGFHFSPEGNRLHRNAKKWKTNLARRAQLQFPSRWKPFLAYVVRGMFLRGNTHNGRQKPSTAISTLAHN